MIGKRLKKMRKDKGINEEELAGIIGVQKSTVSLYKLGKNDPPDKVKIEIAKYFNISLDYLIGGIDEPVPYFRKDLFVRLHDDMSEEEKYLLLKYMDYLDYMRHETNNT